MDRLEVGERSADESDQTLVSAWPGYGGQQPGPASSQMADDDNQPPPDTHIHETWDRVTAGKLQAPRAQWGDDDIPDLQSVANSSDTDDHESFTIHPVREQYCLFNPLLAYMYTGRP
jgi:hypothetical protein